MLHDEIVNVRDLQDIPYATRRKLEGDDQRGGPIDNRADPKGHDVIADAQLHDDILSRTSGDDARHIGRVWSVTSMTGRDKRL
jgi:hypothetical protein